MDASFTVTVTGNDTGGPGDGTRAPGCGTRGAHPTDATSATAAG